MEGMKKIVIMILAVLMMVVNAIPAFAANSKYNEDKPLTSKQIIQLTVSEGHKHTYIDASNGCRYQLYHSCMDGMVGRTPTNHSSTVTIDGVKYSLCNYASRNTVCYYASVIKKIEDSTASSVATKKKIALQKIVLNKTSLTLKVGSTARLSVAYTPMNTTENKSVSWSSSNTSVAVVKGGTITAKKAGITTVTAKVGSQTAVCKVIVKSPLKSITLNKTTASVTVGKSITLTVTYNPANTTDKKTVAWSSSNTSIVTVSGGKVQAKKAGTAIVTAKVGSKKATCKVIVKIAASGRNQASGGSYKNVSDAYTILNTFRTTRANQWYWNTNNTSKITTYGLKGLTKDAALEKVAKTRAKEAWVMYYEKGKLTHDRPDGTSWFTAYPVSMQYKGENLAWGQATSSTVITDPIRGWAETNADYSGQGHRRNMLDSGFTKVGIACYVKEGKTCWAMCLGR